MAYITREDGVRFVIPSYRDVLTTKQKSALKKDVLGLSKSYGEYITMQKKPGSQYEVAFSPDSGYLLGETIWQYFKAPPDLVFCEEVPNTTEAILVIVKGGSVYLDGSFPKEGIPEELVIFLTQQNNFEIYVSGDVPISKKPEDGKFSFDPSSVKSFTVLDHPVFSHLPLLKNYQLLPVEQVLKAQGIGQLPVLPIAIVLGMVGLGFGIYMLSGIFAPPPPKQPEYGPDPYQPFYDALTSPAPDVEMKQFADNLQTFFRLPKEAGWMVMNISYSHGGSITATVGSMGSKIQTLFDWAKKNQASVGIGSNSINISINVDVSPSRRNPMEINPIRQIVARLKDGMSNIYNAPMTITDPSMVNNSFYQLTATITLNKLSPEFVSLFSEPLKNLPVVLQSANLDVASGTLSGPIIIQVLGS